MTAQDFVKTNNKANCHSPISNCTNYDEPMASIDREEVDNLRNKAANLQYDFIHPELTAKVSNNHTQPNRNYYYARRYFTPTINHPISPSPADPAPPSNKYYYSNKVQTSNVSARQNYVKNGPRTQPTPQNETEPTTQDAQNKENVKSCGARPYSERSPVETVRYYRPKKATTIETKDPKSTQNAPTNVVSNMNSKVSKNRKDKSLTSINSAKVSPRMNGDKNDKNVKKSYEEIDSCAWGWFVDLDEMFVHPCIDSRN